MPKVLFAVSYHVKPEKRNAYLTHVRELRERLRSEGGRHYEVFQAKGDKNQFEEIFFSNSEEEIDAMDDNMDEATRTLLGKIEDCMEKGTTRYKTMTEIG